MTELTVIGSKILVDLPEFKLRGIPAKVDTGAYTSSIWASNFNEQNGFLEFTLFDEGSPFYSGEVIRTKDYRINPIKSSFGHQELRYVVNIKVKVGKKVIKATFSLADRSSNRYPVLIGRRTIKNKFVVDVTKNTIKDRYRVLVIDFKEINSVKNFFARIHQKHPKLEIDVITFDDIELKLEGDQAIVKVKGKLANLQDYDYVFFKSTSSQQEMSVSLAHLLHRLQIPFMDKANRYWPLNGKVSQYVVLQANGIPVPTTIYMKLNELAKQYDYLCGELGLPFILKDARGSKGRHNFLISDRESFNHAFEEVAKGDKTLLAQKFVSNDGDYRILVFGSKIYLVIHRKAADNTHLNNTSAGGKANLVGIDSIPQDIQKMSLTAARLLKFDVSGVDMVQDKSSGQWYCLEVNNGPQIASGSFVSEKSDAFGDFLIDRLEKGA